MSSDRHPLWQLADDLQKDLRSAMARLVALRSQLAALELPDAEQLACSHCGLSFPGPQTLSEHLYASHAGPEPQHWVDLEARIAPEEEEAAG